MSKEINTILSKQNIDETLQKTISEAFDKEIARATTRLEKEIRGELAETYKEDIQTMQHALANFLETKMDDYVKDLHEGVKSVEALKGNLAAEIARVKPATAAFCKENARVLEAFVNDKVDSEIKELQADFREQRRQQNQMAVANEHEFENTQNDFKRKAAMVLEHIVNTTVDGAMEELYADIDSAKKNQFGVKIYEAFRKEFYAQFHNTNVEYKQIQNEFNSYKNKAAKRINETTKSADKWKSLAAGYKKSCEELQEDRVRVGKINNLLKNLKGSSRVRMRSILESTSTDRLDSAFKRHYSSMAGTNVEKSAGRKPSRARTRRRSADVFTSTGNTSINETSYDDFDDDVKRARERAGI